MFVSANGNASTLITNVNRNREPALTNHRDAEFSKNSEILWTNFIGVERKTDVRTRHWIILLNDRVDTFHDIFRRFVVAWHNDNHFWGIIIEEVSVSSFPAYRFVEDVVDNYACWQ